MQKTAALRAAAVFLIIQYLKHGGRSAPPPGQWQVKRELFSSADATDFIKKCQYMPLGRVTNSQIPFCLSIPKNAASQLQY